MNRSAATLVADAVASFRGHGWQVQVAGDAAEARDRLLAVVGSQARVAVRECPAWREIDAQPHLAVGGRLVRCGPGIDAPSRADLLAVDVGVTGATALVVETATALIGADDAYAQLVSNLPFSHVVLAHTHAIVPTLGEGLGLVRYFAQGVLGRPVPRYVGAVSGASRTGDIEMVIVEGMHGPGRVHLILLDFPAPGWEALPPEAFTA